MLHSENSEAQHYTNFSLTAFATALLRLIASGFGVIPLSVAVVLHEGSTIVVVLNALRLLAWHEPAAVT
ncbi:MAG: hypothetical protein PSV43_08340 [Prosthecobacter sp.]|nr:hypothetical protein [Prosthecobacter sp.]MDI1312153.1 hypothetical protein [Prosthecobacter sp.]